MLSIDGSLGEGGGQILRTSLALSLVTGQPFRVEKIRAGRRNPGLRRQHLAAVRAAAAVGRADVDGATEGSQRLTFRPGVVSSGEFHFDLGTAASTTLVLQTILPALVTAGGRSRVRLQGGTHNPSAPPFDFLERCFVPLLHAMGPRVELRLERPGFYPAGGGAFTATIEPTPKLVGVELVERGRVRSRRVTAIVARLPESIARRELDVARRRLDWEPECFRTEVVEDSRGPGNLVLIEIDAQRVTEIVSSFGMRGRRAEVVADAAVDAILGYLSTRAPVGSRLADQLMLPLALAGEGRYRTVQPTAHTWTQGEIIRRFLGLDVRPRQVSDDLWEVSAVGPSRR